jgi:hypothetical protein
VAERRVPFYKLGHGRSAPIRIARSDLEAYLAAHRVEPVEVPR